MMLSKADFKINSMAELVEFLPMALFLGLLGPFLIASYTVGFVMDKTGWLKTST